MSLLGNYLPTEYVTCQYKRSITNKNRNNAGSMKK